MVTFFLKNKAVLQNVERNSTNSSILYDVPEFISCLVGFQICIYIPEYDYILPRCEGVAVSVSAFAKDIIVYQVEYCAYSQLRSPSSFAKDNKFTAGNFEALLHVGETGISYYTPSSAVL